MHADRKDKGYLFRWDVEGSYPACDFERMNTNKDLGERIEKLVRELVGTHMTETRATVLAAVTHVLRKIVAVRTAIGTRLMCLPIHSMTSTK